MNSFVSNDHCEHVTTYLLVLYKKERCIISNSLCNLPYEAAYMNINGCCWIIFIIYADPPY